MSNVRVKREVFITLGFCESCELEVAVCAPEAFVFGELNCPWCGGRCAQPSSIGTVDGQVTALASPRVACLKWWHDVLGRVVRDFGNPRREPMRRKS